MTAAQKLCVAACSMVGLGGAGCEGLFGVDFSDAHRASVGDAGSGGAPPVGHEWTKLDLLDGTDGTAHATTDFVNAIWCDALDRCVVATEGADFEPGNIYAATHEEVTRIVLEGDSVASDTAFIGLSPTPDGLVARINRAEPLVLSTMDFTSPSGWRTIDPGDLGAFEGAFNRQMWFQTSSSGSQLALTNAVLAAGTAPGSTATWIPTWAPPGTPSNFFDLLVADPMLCTVGPSIQRGPAGWISDDLQLVAFAVGNGIDDAYPGACVSTDGAETFRHAPLPEGDVDYGGPRGLRCLDADHCWLFGQDEVARQAYIYVSNGPLGEELTWTRASITTGPERTLRDIAFAPDHLHGWAVGTEAPGRGLLIATEDGGKTWTANLVAEVAAFDEAELLTVFALDEKNLWIGGERGLLMSNGRSGR